MDKEVLLKQLGARIREIRKDKGITQAQLALNIAKDQQIISRLEAGEYNPSYFFLCEISNGLGMTIDEVLKGEK